METQLNRGGLPGVPLQRRGGILDSVLKTSKFIPIKSHGHEDSVATENSLVYQSKISPVICTGS